MAEKWNSFVPAKNYRPWQTLPLLYPCQVQFSSLHSCYAVQPTLHQMHAAAWPAICTTSH